MVDISEMATVTERETLKATASSSTREPTDDCNEDGVGSTADWNKSRDVRDVRDVRESADDDIQSSDRQVDRAETTNQVPEVSQTKDINVESEDTSFDIEETIAMVMKELDIKDNTEEVFPVERTSGDGSSTKSIKLASQFELNQNDSDGTKDNDEKKKSLSVDISEKLDDIEDEITSIDSFASDKTTALLRVRQESHPNLSLLYSDTEEDSPDENNQLKLDDTSNVKILDSSSPDPTLTNAKVEKEIGVEKGSVQPTSDHQSEADSTVYHKEAMSNNTSRPVGVNPSKAVIATPYGLYKATDNNSTSPKRAKSGIKTPKSSSAKQSNQTTKAPFQKRVSMVNITRRLAKPGPQNPPNSKKRAKTASGPRQLQREMSMDTSASRASQFGNKSEFLQRTTGDVKVTKNKDNKANGFILNEKATPTQPSLSSATSHNHAEDQKILIENEAMREPPEDKLNEEQVEPIPEVEPEKSDGGINEDDKNGTNGGDGSTGDNHRGGAGGGAGGDDGGGEGSNKSGRRKVSYSQYTDRILELLQDTSETDPETLLAMKKKIKKRRPVSLMSNNGSMIKSVIPYMPMPMAIICLILNIILPGVGTIISGFTVLCCGKPRTESKDDKIAITIVMNTIVGLSQLMTVAFMLVGWFWSVSWGIHMIILSRRYRKVKALESKILETHYLKSQETDPFTVHSSVQR